MAAHCRHAFPGTFCSCLRVVSSVDGLPSFRFDKPLAAHLGLSSSCGVTSGCCVPQRPHVQKAALHSESIVLYDPGLHCSVQLRPQGSPNPKRIHTVTVHLCQDLPHNVPCEVHVCMAKCMQHMHVSTCKRMDCAMVPLLGLCALLFATDIAPAIAKVSAGQEMPASWRAATQQRTARRSGPQRYDCARPMSHTIKRSTNRVAPQIKHSSRKWPV